MPVVLFAIPAILNWGARTQVLDSVVQSVPIFVVNNLSPSRYHVVQVGYNLMQRDSKAEDIAILVDLPPRPRQL